jgi:hypothetical protein
MNRKVHEPTGTEVQLFVCKPTTMKDSATPSMAPTKMASLRGNSNKQFHSLQHISAMSTEPKPFILLAYHETLLQQIQTYEMGIFNVWLVRRIAFNLSFVVAIIQGLLRLNCAASTPCQSPWGVAVMVRANLTPSTVDLGL